MHSCNSQRKVEKATEKFECQELFEQHSESEEEDDWYKIPKKSRVEEKKNLMESLNLLTKAVEHMKDELRKVDTKTFTQEVIELKKEVKTQISDLKASLLFEKKNQLDEPQSSKRNELAQPLIEIKEENEAKAETQKSLQKLESQVLQLQKDLITERAERNEAEEQLRQQLLNLQEQLEQQQNMAQQQNAQQNQMDMQARSSIVKPYQATYGRLLQTAPATAQTVHAQLANNPPGPAWQPTTLDENRTVIWGGVLEWFENNKTSNDAVKQTWQMPCEIAANKLGDAEVRAESWPTKLIMHLMPKVLIGNIGQAYLKNSKSVVFYPSACDALESLIKVMSNGFAGCVHFMQTTACNIKVLVLLYAAEKRTFLGFIPNDQEAFIDRLRKVIQEQKSTHANMIRQGPGNFKANCIRH